MNFLPRGLQIEPCRTVDLGKIPHLTGPWWPLHREAIAPDRRRIAIALDRPGVDCFAAVFLDAEIHRRSVRNEAGFFGKFATSGRDRFLVRSEFALGQRPGMVVFPGPEGPARMNQQDLGVGVPVAVKQKAGAAFHGALFRTGGAARQWAFRWRIARLSGSVQVGCIRV